MIRSKRSLAFILSMALLLSACQPSSLIASLETVINAAEIALPIIGGAAGLQPQVIDAIVKYLGAVDSAISQASTILAGPGTSAQKSAQIISAFAGVATGCQCLPPGVPSTVVAVIDAVAKAVGKFLANFPTATGLTAGKPVDIKLTGTDRAALANIRNRAEQHKAKLAGVKK